VIAPDPFLDDRTSLEPGDAVAAILVLPDGRYLLQHRDSRPGIFYPDHWGCFGGGVEGTDTDRRGALRRELREELALAIPSDAVAYFTDFTFDLSFCGAGKLFRTYFEIRLPEDRLSKLRLAEGREVRAFVAREALAGLRLVPYDAFALWLHTNRTRLTPSRRT
jgi:8-oxo-dGTP pyrophosphatase MutT (NUDIX family)